jgi:hypothetical protein
VLAAKSLGPTQRARILGWMLEPDEISAPLFLELMTTSTFRLAPPTHFAALHQMLIAARGSGYIP